MADISLEGTNLLTCPFSIPNHDVPPGQILHRWSASHVAHPAIIITPRTEQDIRSAILFARRNGLCVLPAGGGHGAFVPVGPRTLYLDMRSNFKAVRLDADEGTVCVGGGVLTGELVRELGEAGRCTAVANLDAVGVVGCILGGGNSSMNGLLGCMPDNALSFRLVTAAGDVVQVGADESSGSGPESAALFRALCGAGHGLGVVTSVTMRVHPITSLRLTDNTKVWSHTMLFPPSAINDAAQAFLSFHPPPKPLNAVLIFTRSPPPSSSPIIALTITYYGPSDAASACTAHLSQPNLVAKALKAETQLVPLAHINDALEPFNAHGGFKTVSSARLHALPLDSLQAAFTRWLAATDDPDAARSGAVFHTFDPTRLRELGDEPAGRGKFVEARDRGFNAVITAWCYKPETRAVLSTYSRDMLSICRQGDAHLVPRTLPNNMNLGAPLEDLFTDERLAELDKLSKRWDAEGVFWNPYRR